jgi:nucleotidyltransferase/DNA polymerase involved in DNA repair
MIPPHTRLDDVGDFRLFAGMERDKTSSRNALNFHRKSQISSAQEGPHPLFDPPRWDALVKCPDAVYVKRDFRWYEVLSRVMLEVMREFSPRVEYYSIDEFFFSALPARGQTFDELARSIRDRITARVGVPVTVGRLTVWVLYKNGQAGSGQNTLGVPSITRS